MRLSTLLSVALLVAAGTAQDAHVTVIDCSTDSVAASLIPGGSVVEPVACGQQSNHLYVVSFDGLHVVDCSTDQIIDREPGYYPMPGWDYVHNTINNQLYCPSENRVFVYNCDSMSIVDSVVFGQYVQEMAWVSSANKLYVTVYDDEAILVIDCSADTLLTRIPVTGYTPSNLCPAETASKLYFARNNSVGIVDATSDTLLPAISMLGWPNLLWDPVGNQVYAYVYVPSWLCVIDCDTDSVVDTIPCPGGSALTLNTRDRMLYSASYDRLYVVSLDSGLVTDTVDVELTHMVWDSVDNKLYCLRSSLPFDYDSLAVVVCSTYEVTGQFGLPDRRSHGMVWNAWMNKLYVGGDNWS